MRRTVSSTVSTTDRRVLWAVLALGVLVACVVAAWLASPGRTARPAGTSGPVAVDGDRPVRMLGTTVRTPCFTYDVPDEGWVLVPGAAGCTTAISYGEVADDLTTLHVRAQAGTTGGDVAELVEVSRRSLADAGMDDWEVDVTTVGGRTVVRMSGRDAWGFPRVTYQVPLEGERFSQDGRAFDAVWVDGPPSSASEAWLDAVIRSLRVR
ncbi:hypothetical protein [Cellulomonas fimi]|uniref:Lipoprotein n=1 Tax=Cellulomonas fimi (strain ATCC 484 / DSM 20113 / JCM 1341 / CCUG 24087 / LMG 16345 / NBRC 15513 / NCIMB 8980 / NCTC 7547 / NRS-133) TaxID=590998 RepID=F4H2P3_CELFA|nr:hypothetical protein [Cellulomonas fimi]AEE45269.1 hypothetical protein Celf_1134 [Cellulomonas fimi ATCC 484]NNH08014.1 hypothetical protein [Cellulomonas fimi]VEH28762.1 Uncharacterised protein [Cellulomonas fimi]